MAEPIEVVLTSAEILSAAMAGVMRETENIKLGRQPAYGASTSSNWQKNIEGALGECALAKALNLYWPGKGGFREHDVHNMQVRSSERDDARLIIHKEDGDGDLFWLVTGKLGKYKVHGCISGEHAKREEWWSDPSGTGRPAYFVPREALEMLT